MKNEKRKMKNMVLAMLFFLMSTACSVQPEPIQYGEDNCAHCSMTIMDKRFGTEIVTNKGKVFKFDSVECLVEFLQEKKVKQEDVKLVLVTPFNHPEELVDAGTSQVLHCKELPSPMGKYLTAFKDKNEAVKFSDKYGGDLFTWDELIKEYKNLH